MADERDTIAGLATPWGAAGIGVIRLSGAQALAVATLVAPGLASARPRQLKLCRLIRPGTQQWLDLALVCYMPGPKSYSGEDVVELQVHGGPATVSAVLDAVVQAGARIAQPGEFTRRAFENGRIDLSEAEAVAALVGARSDRARRVALQQLAGGLGGRVRALKRDCVSVLAEVEARLDFPEEDLEQLSADALKTRLKRLGEALEALLATATQGRMIREGARVVLLGRPNVGKSSLLNALVGRERALVHAVAGTTRDYVEDEVGVDGMNLTIVDTAGQREGASAAEDMGVERSWQQACQADLVALVLHLGEGVTPEDRRLMERLHGKRWGVVLNQADRVDDEAIEGARRQLAMAGGLGSDRPPEELGVTAVPEGRGVEALRRKLRARLMGDHEVLDGAPLLTEKRHVEAIRIACEKIRIAGQALTRGDPEELVAVELRGAAGSMGALIGEGVTEDVLDAIFSRFCIGK